MCLLAICFSSLEKYIFRSSALFLVRLFHFLCWIVWAIYIFWILTRIGSFLRESENFQKYIPLIPLTLDSWSKKPWDKFWLKVTQVSSLFIQILVWFRFSSITKRKRCMKQVGREARFSATHLSRNFGETLGQSSIFV